jgi:hypothetical protein
VASVLTPRFSSSQFDHPRLAHFFQWVPQLQMGCAKQQAGRCKMTATMSLILLHACHHGFEASLFEENECSLILENGIEKA